MSCCHYDLIIARVQTVHLMNAEQCNSQTKPNDMGHELACLPAAIIHTHHHHFYYHSARKLTLMASHCWQRLAETQRYLVTYEHQMF